MMGNRNYISYSKEFYEESEKEIQRIIEKERKDRELNQSELKKLHDFIDKEL